MADTQDNSWRTQSFRQNVRGKIEEAIRQSGNPTTKSVAEMENHVFQKAKTKEEYLGFVARLIIHVREMIDDDTDSESSSSSDSEVETYVDDDTVEDTDEETDEDVGKLSNGPASSAAAGALNNQASSDTSSGPRGVKRKHMESGTSIASKRLASQRWNSQMNEWEAVGVNVYKKLQRMDPHQALYAESLITKVLRLGLLNSLSSDLDICKKPQYNLDFASSGLPNNNLVNHLATPMFVNANQSVGTSTFTNTIPMSTSFPVITTHNSAFESQNGTSVEDHNSPQNSIYPQTSSAEDQSSVQNNMSIGTPSTVITFKAEPVLE